jgi:hypothetical protein
MSKRQVMMLISIAANALYKVRFNALYTLSALVRY